MIDKLIQFFDNRVRKGFESGSPEDSEHSLRLAAAVLMIELMGADFEAAPEERERIMELIRERYLLSAQETRDLVELAEAEAAEATSLQQFTRTLTENLEMEEREHLVELLWDVAYADGRVDKYEEHLMRRLADLLYVSHAAFIRTKHRAAERAPSS
ncbi:MAG: TerB family tellurite resistance protein [Chromatiales bacterium]|jgi:uncharacterized tellurite resistance protein B-like protein